MAGPATTRRALLGGAGLMLGATALPVRADAAPHVPAEWKTFLDQHWWAGPAVGEVCLHAAERGYRPEDISAVSLVNVECPAMAPALHFKQANGDNHIVTRSGVLVVYDRLRRGRRLV